MDKHSKLNNPHNSRTQSKGYLASYEKRKKSQILTKSPSSKLKAESPKKKEPFSIIPQGNILDISSIKGEITNISIESSLFDQKNIFNEKLRMKALSKIPRPEIRLFSSPRLEDRKFCKVKSTPLFPYKNR